LDLAALSDSPTFRSLCPADFPISTLKQPNLNEFAALGRKTVNAVRLVVKDLLLDTTSTLRDNEKLRDAVVVNTLQQGVDVQMHLPFDTRDFSDFLTSRVVSRPNYT
jgi:hypothetical protein